MSADASFWAWWSMMIKKILLLRLVTHSADLINPFLNPLGVLLEQKNWKNSKTKKNYKNIILLQELRNREKREKIMKIYGLITVQLTNAAVVRRQANFNRVSLKYTRAQSQVSSCPNHAVYNRIKHTII